MHERVVKELADILSFNFFDFITIVFDPCHHRCYNFLEVRRSADEGCQQIIRCFSKLANQQIRRCFSKLALPGREGHCSLLELLGPMSDPAKRSKNAKVARNWEIESGKQIKDRVTRQGEGREPEQIFPSSAFCRSRSIGRGGAEAKKLQQIKNKQKFCRSSSIEEGGEQALQIYTKLFHFTYIIQYRSIAYSVD